jgi:hypothetical protein
VARLTEWKCEAGRKRIWLAVKGHVLLKTRNLLPFGLRDVYRGLTGAFLGTIPVALIYFAAYESTLLPFPK